jgi:hypothetical protein
MPPPMAPPLQPPMAPPLQPPIPPAPVSVRASAPSLHTALPVPPPAPIPSHGASTPIGFAGASAPITIGAGALGSPSPSVAAPPAPPAPVAPSATPSKDRPSGNGAAVFDGAFGARSASDAAAAREREKSESSPRATSPEPSARRALVDLLAFDPTLPGRLRRDASLSKLVVKASPPKPALRTDEPAPKPPSEEERGRWEVLRVLSHATPLDAAQARDALAASLDDDAQLEMPILIVGGELRPSFDEIRTLEAAAQIAQPSSSANKALAPLVKLATDTAQAPHPPTREVTVHVVKQLELAMAASPGLPPKFFSTQLERLLLEGRAYKRRTLFGAPRIRAELVFGAGEPVPIYLPEASQDLLPLLPSFPAIAAAELRPREDASEMQAECLVALALARVVRRAK